MKKTILVVNDDAVPVNVFKAVLEHFGYSVLTALDSSECLKIYRTMKEDIDLVILDDLILGVKDGIETQEELYKINPHVKTVFTTACIDEPRYRAKGIVKTIMMSPKMRELLNVVESALETKIEHLDIIEKFLSKIDPTNKLNLQEASFVFDEINKRIGFVKRDIDEIVLSERGYTSTTGFEFKDIFVKVDISSRLNHEYEVYCLDLGEFNKFRAKPIYFVEGDGIGIFAMDNLKKYERGLLKTRFIKEDFYYNLFLMGLFHKEATQHIDQFDQVIYSGVNGLPHWNESYEPKVNLNGEGLFRFKETEIEFKSVKDIINYYLTRQKAEAAVVIHGDWKDDNLINGHLVDYAMVGIGFEVDELAYYLSEPRFNVDLPGFHRVIDQYVLIRSQHDLDFKVRAESGYRKNMHQLADSAFLSQLVLRHSVMNKRDMMIDEKYQQRQYYQNTINKVLREGKFI